MISLTKRKLPVMKANKIEVKMQKYTDNNIANVLRLSFVFLCTSVE